MTTGRTLDDQILGTIFDLLTHFGFNPIQVRALSLGLLAGWKAVSTGQDVISIPLDDFRIEDLSKEQALARAKTRLGLVDLIPEVGDGDV